MIRKSVRPVESLTCQVELFVHPNISVNPFTHNTANFEQHLAIEVDAIFYHSGAASRSIVISFLIKELQQLLSLRPS